MLACSDVLHLYHILPHAQRVEERAWAFPFCGKELAWVVGVLWLWLIGVPRRYVVRVKMPVNSP
jgi:hypothetical protein